MSDPRPDVRQTPRGGLRPAPKRGATLGPQEPPRARVGGGGAAPRGLRSAVRPRGAEWARRWCRSPPPPPPRPRWEQRCAGGRAGAGADAPGLLAVRGIRPAAPGRGVLGRCLPTAANRTPPPPALQPGTPPALNRDRFETLPQKGTPSPPSRAWHCPHPPPLNPARPRRLSDRAWQLRAAGKAGGLPAALSDSPLAAAHRRAPSPSPSPPPAPHAVSPSLSHTRTHTRAHASSRSPFTRRCTDSHLMGGGKLSD
ncbi:formin-like protein 3 [Aquila chrysaetos chrysaetos]|uniref:formin-like protein 3 n=1 Tax=Aquila chrysaetos chrysaetos TaxID=223781 RepID=UPI001176EBD6|nr:formin-like protein 3 [Aquila chrysaetos chrysaetos]